MTPPNLQLAVVITLNALLCLGIAWASVCRSAKTSLRTTRAAYRYLYAATGTAAFFSAWAWYWLGPWPHLVLLGCYLGHLALNSRAWWYGPPAIALKSMPFSSTPPSTPERHVP